MKLPALTFPRLPQAGLQRGPFAWRTLLLGAAVFVPAVLLGFLFGFPTAAVKQKIVDTIREQQGSAELQALKLSPLLALKGEKLVIGMDSAGLPPLTVERFSLRPLWGSLLSGEPGAKVAAELLQGELQAEVHRGGRTAAQASGLRFSLPLADGMATVTGTLASGQLTRTSADGRTGESALTLAFGELLAQSPLLAGRPLALGQVTVEARGRGQAYTITRLEASGGDLTATGSGSVLAGRTPAASRLNLTLRLRPTATFPADLKSLLDLMAAPAGDGSYPLQISGTLALPRIVTAGAGPADTGTPLEESAEE